MIPLVDLKAQYAQIAQEVDTAFTDILANTRFIMGQEVSSFEANFATYMQAEHALGVSNGTEALRLAMVALGLGAGDEVIAPSHTYIATIEPMIQLGIKPVFVDIDPKTYTLDPALIEAAITERTRAIAPVHIYGQPANMPAIADIARRHNLHIIEDAAQAHGAEYAGERVGTHADIAGYSFYPGKNLGAYGDAGGITTNNADYAQQMRLLLNHGSASKYDHVVVGYNARLDTLQAAVLDIKLKYIEAWTEQRRANAAIYNELLADVEGVVRPYADPAARHVYHLYVIQVPGDRQAVFDAMQAGGVGVGIHYPYPVHLQLAMEHLGYERGSLPITEQLCEAIISLPMYPELTTEDIETVVKTLRSVLQGSRV